MYLVIFHIRKKGEERLLRSVEKVFEDAFLEEEIMGAKETLSLGSGRFGGYDVTVQQVIKVPRQNQKPKKPAKRG